MEKPIFREKSMERISSPEQLNDYIKVTHAGIWLALAAVLVLLAGFIVWGIVGKLETKVNAVAVSEEGTVVCYVRESEAAEIAVGETVRVNGAEYTVASISAEPIAVTGGEGGFSDYVRKVGELSVGEWVYEVTLSGELPSGVYQATIVTDSVSPISYLFN